MDRERDVTIKPEAQILFTVFTPTYNRAHTLPRLYESIRRQTLRNFEWIIVDDGSTDGTDELVRSWQSAGNDFPIRYIWQFNQHKKVAFNRGVREAKGRWFICIDSDDELLHDSLEQFERMWSTIAPQDRDLYAAVVGLCVDDKGIIVGEKFPGEYIDASSVELWFDYRVNGEKFSCMRTDVLRKFPFPENIPDLVPENVVWFRISRQYIQRCYNIPLRIYHRDNMSLTQPNDPLMSKYKSAEGALLSCAEALDWITWPRFLHSPTRILFLAVQYSRWAAYLPPQRRRFSPQRRGPRFLAGLMRPFGMLLYWFDQLGVTRYLHGIVSRIGFRFY